MGEEGGNIMAVRNFWVELEVDGKQNDVASGPRNSNGGIVVRIKQRNYGAIETAAVIRGIAIPQDDGKIRLELRLDDQILYSTIR
jgi:hypothetical protein